MPKYIMFEKYFTKALKGISSERTDKAVELIKKMVEKLYQCML